jgi:phage portal protein BeeE
MREAAELGSLLDQRLREITAEQLGAPTRISMQRHPTVVAARTLIADAAGMLPLVDVRNGEVLTPTPSILLRPDPSAGMTRRRFVHRAAMCLTGWGNLFLRLSRIGSNDWPLAAEVLHPGYITPEYDPADPTVIAGYTYLGAQIPLGDVVHVPLEELELGLVARSPLQDCQQAFDDLALLWGFATGYWRDGGLPPYVLRHPNRLNATQASEALEQWLTARTERRPGLLSGQWEIDGLPVPSAQDALLLEGLAYIDQTIARIFGVTPTLLNVKAEAGGLTYVNAQDEVRRWLNLSLYPTWLARLEDAFTQMLPRGQQALFDTSHLGALGLTRPGADEARGPTSAPIPATPRTPNGSANV